MTIITWDDSLSVGIDLIDEQHQMLIQRLNDFSEAVSQNLGPAEISKTLDFLVEYTNFHFTAEEAEMARASYPALDGHRVKHQEFIGTLDNLVEDFAEEGATEMLSNAIDTFLVNWLLNHIKTVDVAFGEFLNK